MRQPIGTRVKFSVRQNLSSTNYRGIVGRPVRLLLKQFVHVQTSLSDPVGQKCSLVQKYREGNSS
jgi:hypothetical protein